MKWDIHGPNLLTPGWSSSLRERLEPEGLALLFLLSGSPVSLSCLLSDSVEHVNRRHVLLASVMSTPTLFPP